MQNNQFRLIDKSEKMVRKIGCRKRSSSLVRSSPKCKPSDDESESVTTSLWSQEEKYNDLNINEGCSAPKRRSYSLQFKMEVLESGLKEGKRKTSRKFGVAESLVRCWIKKKDEIQQNLKAEIHDIKSCDASTELDKEILKWFRLWKCKGKTITKNMLTAKANILYSKAGYSQYFNSETWYSRWNDTYKKNCCNFSNDDVATEQNISKNLFDISEDSSNEMTGDCVPYADTGLTFQQDSLDNSSSVSCKISSELSSESENTPLARKKGEHYLPQFKTQVVNYARLYNNKKAALKYGVHQATVGEWCRIANIQHKSEDPTHVRAVASRCDFINHKDPEEALVSWLKSCRESAMVLSTNDVRCKIEMLLKDTSNLGTDRRYKWLVDWVARMKDGYYERIVENFDKDDTSFVRVLVAYPPSIKKEIAEFAKRSSISAASKTFLVARKRISAWIKDKSFEMKKPRRTACRSTLTLQLDEELFVWYKQMMKDSGFQPKSESVRAKSMELFKAAGQSHFKSSYSWYKGWCKRHNITLRYEHDDQILAWLLEQFDENKNVSHGNLQAYALSIICKDKPEFKSSAGWAIRFCKRNENIIGKIPSIDSQFPSSMEEKIVRFRQYVIDAIGNHGILPAGIGCMDEIPLNFSQSSSKSYVNRRKLLMRQPSFDSCQAVIVLASLANGQLLPPMVIVKGTEGAEDMPKTNFSSGHIAYQQDGIMDESVMLNWLNRVWSPYITSKSILILDCYQRHHSPLIMDRLRSSGTTSATIPPGCSSKLQPLDLGLKQLLHAQLNRIISDYQTDNCKHIPSTDQIVGWIAEIWTRLDQEQKLIRESFVQVGLTTSSTIQNNESTSQ